MTSHSSSYPDGALAKQLLKMDGAIRDVMKEYVVLQDILREFMNQFDEFAKGARDADFLRHKLEQMEEKQIQLEMSLSAREKELAQFTSAFLGNPSNSVS